MLLLELDLACDTVVVTADHGHTRRGGHGGREAEVMRVPLVMAGRGIRAGAALDHPRLIDIAPTVAALLGVPAPGHGLGRTLVEALAVDADRGAALAAADRRRVARNLATVAAARAALSPRSASLPRRPGAAQVIFLLCALAGAAAARRLGLRAERWIWLLAAAGYPAVLAALLVAVGGDLSPSCLSSRAEAENCLLWVGLCAAAAHQAAALLVLRRRGGHVERLRAAGGLVGIGLALAHVVPAAAAVAVGELPGLDLPSAPIMFLVPALDMALATYAAAVAITLWLELVHSSCPPRCRSSLAAAPFPAVSSGAPSTRRTPWPSVSSKIFGR
jgi:hypothetical protein